jgi:myo-inositol-1(or 4)-monophosphatase
MISQRTPLKSPIINVISSAILKASKGLLRDFGEIERLQVSQKSLGNFVSSADLRIEKVLQTELHKARPSFGMITEESGEVLFADESDSRWIIDPLDGTKNFIHGIPHFAISVAFEQRGEVVAGITYDPVKDEMFAAEKGCGAFMNDKRLRVSNRKTMSESLIATGPSLVHKESYFNFLQKIHATIFGFRRMGASSLDLAYVAAGRLDAFIEMEPLIWDTAVGALLVRESGGFVTAVDGGLRPDTQGSILASNGKVHNDLVQTFKV